MGRSRRAFKDKSSRVKRRPSKHARSKAKRYMKSRRATNLRKRRSRHRSRNIAAAWRGGAARQLREADYYDEGRRAKSKVRAKNEEKNQRLRNFRKMDEELEALKKLQMKQKIEAAQQAIARRAERA